MFKLVNSHRELFALTVPVLGCVDDLREFFEVNCGPILDALVIGSQAGDQMQSRGFEFVTFKHAASVSAAVEAHYGKKVWDGEELTLVDL